jgi:hypothetical protein
MAEKPEEEFEIDEVDVEEYAKQCKKLPRARRYRIRIDRERYVVKSPFVTKADLLALVGKCAEQWRIHQKLRGGQMDEVKDDEKVDLREQGVERFVTMELTQTDGEAKVDEITSNRRSIRLPEEDEEYLNSLGLDWETLSDGNVRWLLIHGHPIPEDFDRPTATIAIRIERAYPPGKLDMVYIHPPIARQDAKAIPALSSQRIDGDIYQRWSRHYQWREGVDSISTHHLRIKDWLVDELKR